MAAGGGQSFGRALPDQVEHIAAAFDAHIQLLGDVREIYRERAALEREYAGKLQILARKAAERKSKMETSFVVGGDPTKAWDMDTLRQSTLDSAYGEIINSITSAAQDHINVADALTSQVVEVLRAVELKNTEAQKKEMQFFQKLLSDRDRVYADRTKSKQKYDEECIEVELYRQKQGRAGDDRHAERAAKHAEQQRIDMLNGKNSYIISIAIANKSKAKFYENDIPALEDEMQNIQKRLIERFTKIMIHTQNLQLNHLDALKSRISSAEKKFNEVNPSQDQDLFVEYNIRPFTAPPDWKFEPCSIHYDTDAMSIEHAPKVVLQNKLTKCNLKLQELVPLVNAKRREQEQLSKKVEAYIADHLPGSIDEISDNYLDAQHQLSLYTTSERIINVEAETIMAAIGNDVGGLMPHSFKSSSFSIPTQCGYCKTMIWGLSRQGKTCKLCGLSVHSKCELKVPADCQQSEGRQSLPMSRSSTITSNNSLGVSSAIAPAPSSFVQSAVSEDSLNEESHPVARVVFDFKATSEFELGVSEGTTVHVLEPDDGSGWVKVLDAAGSSGLVPATYLEEEEGSSSGNTSAQPGIGQHVRAIYPYQAQGADELELKEGDLLELSSEPNGGQNYGNGWWEGFDCRGKKGIFPSNYVEMA
ncbi:hypothetical protein BDQ12DRAFT_712547 [Crucibulum laeve]|uniref:Uncharacterized protein n=1 Tax=Crucibulum laeve TaxID=68775 RepID=A0A5C3MD04_9AGAR|nr:hypothetical protein BDQ12DRAFT_712547 [Crucibulum laeve]